jgi:uncharacterized protein (DUF1800 family)
MSVRWAIFTTAIWLVSLPLPAKSAKSRKLPDDAAFSRKLSKDEQVRHALDRLTFGPRPGDFDRVKKAGVKKWVEQQLHPERIGESPVLMEKLDPLETLRMTPLEVWKRYPQVPFIVAALRGKPLPDDPDFRDTTTRYATYFKYDENEGQLYKALQPSGRIEEFVTTEQLRILRGGKPEQKLGVLRTVPEEQWDPFIASMDRPLRAQLQPIAPVPMRRRMLMFNSPQQVLSYDLVSSKLHRAILSNRQLAEQLVDFWYNHFNVFIDKGNDRLLVADYEREAIRPNVLARFSEILSATAHSPAMLYYLDNVQSVAPPPEGKPQKGRRGLNENYARELLELHTLGVDGGYTQKDIIEVARCFTGWTVREPKLGSVFWFNEKAHDRGEKVVLGVTIPAGGGIEDAEKVLDILAHHPSTARFVSTKLAQKFVADHPPDALIARMADTFRSTDGDIRAVLQTMLTSKEFWSQGAYRAKVKSPLEMVVSSVRATNAQVIDPFALANQIGTLGEPLYRKVEPTGYLNTNDEWVNSAGLLTRMNFALRFAQNRVAGVRVNTDEFASDIDEAAERLLSSKPSRQTREAIESALAGRKPSPVTPGLVAGLVLGSPEFQRR